MNPYDILGVDRDADEDEIKKAYREKAKEHHPDQGGDEEKFKEVQAAYEMAKDGGEDQFENPFGGPGFGAESYRRQNNKTVEDFIKDFEKWARSGGFNEPGFKGDPFSSKTRGAADAPPGGDVVYDVIIDFETAVYGGTVEVPIGSGKRPIDVPVGIQNGVKKHYSESLDPADVFTVRFRVENNSGFTRKNKNDLYVTKEVSVWDAMTGSNLSVETLDGKKVELDLDPGTQDGDVFRLNDLGGPRTHDGVPQGDLYVTVDIDIPAVTGDHSQQLIEEIRSDG